MPPNFGTTVSSRSLAVTDVVHRGSVIVAVNGSSWGTYDATPRLPTTVVGLISEATSKGVVVCLRRILEEYSDLRFGSRHC